MLKKTLFASLKKPVCQTRNRNRNETIKVVKLLIGKIKDLAHNYGARILFATAPQRDVFISNYCIGRPSLTFCKERKLLNKKYLILCKRKK